MTTPLDEIISELDGISCFDDLLEKINNIPEISLPVLKVILTSFHQEMIFDFEQNAKIYYKDKKLARIRTVRERDFLHNISGMKFDLERHQETVVFDQVTSQETLASIMQLLESGFSIHVFHQWEFRGYEKRSASSLLLRSCIQNARSVSIAEIGVWSSLMTKRFESMKYLDLLEFT
jgi:hypothetical protein